VTSVFEAAQQKVHPRWNSVGWNDSLCRVLERSVRLNQYFCRNTQTIVKVSDHLHSERAFSIQDFGNARTTPNKGL
jgi:hypothetical protein